MNIWALEKDIRIKHLLLLLGECLGANSFSISANPVLNDKAVRIYKTGVPDMSAYLYTYGQPEDRYGVHLEYPEFSGMDTGMNFEMKEDIDFDHLVEVLQVHLDIF